MNDSQVKANVSIGKNVNGGFELALVLDITIWGVAQEVVEDLVKQAHQTCPYSNATRGNIEVKLNVVVL